MLVVSRVATWSRPHHHLQDWWDPRKGDEGRRDAGGLLPPHFSFSLSLSRVTYVFPFIYKRGSRTPKEGVTVNEHRAERAQQDLTPFDLFTRDLGTSPSLARL